MHRGDVEVRLDVAIGGNELSDLQPLAAAELVAVQQPGDVGGGVAGRYALQSQGRSRAQGLFAEAVTDLGWLNCK